MKYTLIFLADRYFIIDGQFMSGKVVCESPVIQNKYMDEQLHILFKIMLDALNSNQ